MKYTNNKYEFSFAYAKSRQGRRGDGGNVAEVRLPCPQTKYGNFTFRQKC